MGDCDPDASLARSIVRGPGDGEVVSLGDAGDVTLKAVGAETGGNLAIYEFSMPPSTAGPPEHLHRSWDEAFIVLDGEMTFLIDGETHLAPAGSVVFIPRGVPHTFWNAGDAPARQVTVFTPAGIEHYFRDVTAVLAAGGEASLDAAVALMGRHDMVVSASDRGGYGALSSRAETG